MEDESNRVSVAAFVHAGTPTVVCDDGSVWGYHAEVGRWVEHYPVPGTARHILVLGG